ncbi:MULTISPECIES: CPBP family intramembrane glutamic endopeptidase [Micrococcus]|nr:MULTISPECIES: type II CAAX endopeptidase family protein [Micrococcus]
MSQPPYNPALFPDEPPRRPVSPEQAPSGVPPQGMPPQQAPYGVAPQGGSGPGGAPPAAPPFPPMPVPAKPLDLPLIGADYSQVLRTPRHRWWHPLGSSGIALGLTIVVMVVGTLAMLPALFASAGPDVLDAPDAVYDAAFESAPIMAINNLMLAALIPVALLAVRWGHPVAARFLHSVTGRVRWAWMLRCTLVLLPIYLVYVVGAWALTGAVALPRSEDWVWMLVMAFVLTPFQAAGEEYLFRGWVLASVGSWFRHPIVGWIVGGLVSTAIFALAHGSLDVWILLDLGAFAAAAVWLTWRTGGLEAAIALHVVNNVVVIAVGTLIGTVTDSYVDPSTAGDPVTALVSAVFSLGCAALLGWQASRAGIQRTVPAEVGARP